MQEGSRFDAAPTRHSARATHTTPGSVSRLLGQRPPRCIGHACTIHAAVKTGSRRGPPAPCKNATATRWRRWCSCQRHQFVQDSPAATDPKGQSTHLCKTPKCMLTAHEGTASSCAVDRPQAQQIRHRCVEFPTGNTLQTERKPRMRGSTPRPRKRRHYRHLLLQGVSTGVCYCSSESPCPVRAACAAGGGICTCCCKFKSNRQ